MVRCVILVKSSEVHWVCAKHLGGLIAIHACNHIHPWELFKPTQFCCRYKQNNLCTQFLDYLIKCVHVVPQMRGHPKRCQNSIFCKLFYRLSLKCLSGERIQCVMQYRDDYRVSPHTREYCNSCIISYHSLKCRQ
jgi:hypothetical protein